MALSSPGVEVKVIDESFYTPAEPGTTPLIIVASAENKSNSGGTGTAPGTLAANAGEVYLLTSQKDLGDTFGDPLFKTDSNNNPIHAGEQNEYGLQAAYSYLGVSNRAFVVRANIDLDQLNASADAPAGYPAANQYWLDTANTTWGVFEWDGAAASTSGAGQKFTKKTVAVYNDSTTVSGGEPKESVGKIGTYAVVTSEPTNPMFYRAESGWVQVGTPAWKEVWPTVISETSNPTSSTSFTINGTTVNPSPDTIDGLVTAISTTVADVTAVKKGDKIYLYTTLNTIVIAGANIAGSGFVAGTYYSPALQTSKHTQVPAFKRTSPAIAATGKPTGSVWIKTTEPNNGARWRVNKFNGTTKLWAQVDAPIYGSGYEAIYALDKVGGGLNIGSGTLYVQSDVEKDNTATFSITKRVTAGATVVTTNAISTTTFGTHASDYYKFSIQQSIPGQAALSQVISVVNIGATTSNAAADAEVFAQAFNGLSFLDADGNAVESYIEATVNDLNQVVIKHTAGGEIYITEGANTPINNAISTYDVVAGTGTKNAYANPLGGYVFSNWAPTAKNVFSYVASATAPTSLTEDGTLWYNSMIDEVDIMVHNGTTWKGYASVYPNTDPAGPQVAAVEPETQSNGDTLEDGDLWISTADMENYPMIYRFSGGLGKFVLLDKSDQTSEDGVLFADARWNTDGGSTEKTIAQMLSSDFLDPDAPDPALYPRGMLLWNLRRSGFNVKKFKLNYIDTTTDNPRFGAAPGESMSTYYPHRWVSEAANQDDGSGSFGRKAQRKVVVQALQATVNSNQQIRDEESRVFNLIACPGYPELIGEMVTLNYDRGLTAVVIGDTPARLTPDATSLLAWGSNQRLAFEDNDLGAASYDEYLAMYYPWGFSSDNFGNNVVIPPSHMVLRTIALNDQVAYPWFAPAGVRRGGVTNATAVGYVSSEGEFKSVALNTGQRDTLYSVEINPITFLTGSGLVVYGQKTRAKGSSALDRVNVARLVCYLRRQLNAMAKPYIFEPNDKITRDQVKSAAESIMLELVGQRALYDYVVVCDTSNNTPSRIDRNELWVDIAIEPVKAVEFIYIPLRLKNTGEIKALG